MFGKRERLYADSRAAEEAAKTEEKAVGKASFSEPPPKPQPAPRPRVLDNQPVLQPKSKVRAGLSSALELTGVTAVSVGGFLVAPWLGCMILGVLLIVLGVATGYGA